jgi:hypothetical protein
VDAAAIGRPDEAGRYEIRLQGRLDPRWSTWFDGLELTPGADGTTVIHGPVADQAALHGLLARLRDIGLPLISVAQIAEEPAQGNQTHHRHCDESTGE